ncbi:nitroreductase/quinone reductase family protein [Halosaccharopolyspora lacisalsi]|nr:nitroreductase/quinone reductase family protein [Halosaccharopolyspora lacisalsi]
MVQRLGGSPWFAAVGRRAVPLDLAVQRRTGGRISLLGLFGLPSLLLITTGRRSGKPRPVPLLYAPRGSECLVVGSNWGRSQHPGWSSNLLAEPDALVRVRGRDVPVRARQVTGAERDRLWREVLTRFWPAYDDYAARAADREIRVFALSPR